MKPPFHVLDERSDPPLRQQLSDVLQEAESADFAVHRIRLAALDLQENELAGGGDWRVLVGRLDAALLLDVPATSSTHFQRLQRFVSSGRLQVRSVGLGGWTPDFAILRGASTTSLIGSIYFGQPHLVTGPAFTVRAHDEETARLLTHRFEELWADAHDVLPAVQRVLARVNGDRLLDGG